MSTLDYKPSYRRNLPHIQPLGATFFITFRLAGSLPRAVVKQWAAEKRRLEQELVRLTDAQERARREREFQRRWFRYSEELLHKAQCGPTWLKDERIAGMVAESLHFRDGKVYRLDAFCIMPNHVHVVFAPLPVNVGQAGSLSNDVQADSLHYSAQVDNLCYYSLASILHSLKRHTARQANRLLGRRGAFWEHESYDHYVRDEDEWRRIVAYVLNNPVKAGLVQHWQEWPWSYYRLA